MENVFGLGRDVASPSQDLGALIIKAAQRYWFLRGPALRTGVANSPMVRLGIGDPLQGAALDLEVDRFMEAWPAAGLCIPAPSELSPESHPLTAAELAFLHTVLASPQARQTQMVLRYAQTAGIADTAHLFSQLVVYTKSLLAWLHLPELAAIPAQDKQRNEPVPTTATTARAWTQKLPSRSGYFWNWSGKAGIEAQLLLVEWAAEVDSFQVAAGQHGFTRSQSCAEWGGWWAELERPDAQSEIADSHVNPCKQPAMSTVA